MSDDQPAQDEQRALTVVKERLIAHSAEPMWDSAAFDHMGRVAAVMAESGLASDTLLNADDGNPANPKTIVARMLLIAHMARECGANPLMFMQGCSRIGKKIHLEGKLVNAIVRARTGVNLRFQFGRWDTDRIELPELHTEGPQRGLPVDPEFFKGVGERLAVRVSDPEDPERHVDGSVGLWKTDRKGSPWTSQGNWRRQLRYRGAPEWARAYEPGAVLGIYSDADQDIDDIEVTAKPVGLMQRLKGAQEGDGFDHEAVQAQTEAEKPKRRGRPPKDPVTSGGSASGEVGSGTVEETVSLVVEDDGIPEHMRDGPATIDEAREELERPTSQEASTETETAPLVEAEPDALEPVTPASDDGLETSDSGPSAEADGGFAPEFLAFIEAVETATAWAGVKTSMRDFYNTETFREMDPQQQNLVRANTWVACARRRHEGALEGLPDHAADLSAFRLWLEDQEDADAIKGTYNALERCDQWKAASEAMRGAIDHAVSVRLGDLS